MDSAFVIISLAYQFPVAANVTRIRLYVGGTGVGESTVTVGVYRPIGLPTTCSFSVISTWQSEAISGTGWHEV